MKLIYLLVTAFLFLIVPASAQTWQWTKPEYNDGGNKAIHDVETDANGNVYVLGEYNGSLYLNNTLITSGTAGSYLAKYNPDGVLQWYKLFHHISGDPGGGYPYINATDIAVNLDGIFVTGKYKGNNYTFYDCNNNKGYGIPIVYLMAGDTLVSDYNENGYFLTKMDFNGNKVWEKLATVPPGACSQYGPYYFYKAGVGYSPILTTDKNNNVIASFLWQGTSASFYVGNDLITLDAGLTYPAAYILTLKYNSSGSLQWSNYAKNSNGTGSLYDINSIAADNNGNLFLYGSSYSGSIFGPFTYSSSTTGASTFIAKLSSSGSWQFVKELCNYNSIYSGTGNGEFITTDDQGNLYATANAPNGSFLLLGSYYLWPNCVLVKLNNNGDFIWYKGVENYPGRLQSIKYANNSLYMSGNATTEETLNSNTIKTFAPLNVQASLCYGCYGGNHYENFTAKADTSGNFIWVNNFAGGYSVGQAVAVYNDNIYTGGYFRDNITTLGNFNNTFQPVDFYTQNLFLGKLKDQYIRVGALSAKQVMPGCVITIPFTSAGLTFSAKNKFTAELSNTNWDFTTATVIGTVKSTGSGTIIATIPATLAYGSSGYKIRIRSSDTLLTGYNYFAYADTGYALTITCPGVASGLSSANITGTTATLNWQTVGCAAGYKLQYRVKGTTAWTTQNTSSTATSLAITGLTPNTLYQWRIATKCNNNGVNSFSVYSPIQQFKTAAAFTVAASINAATQTTNALQIAVMPNPAKTSALLTINGPVTNATITITDFVGKTVWKKDGVNTGQLVLPVQNFAAGIYLVTLSNGSKKSIIKLVKE